MKEETVIYIVKQPGDRERRKKRCMKTEGIVRKRKQKRRREREREKKNTPHQAKHEREKEQRRPLPRKTSPKKKETDTYKAKGGKRISTNKAKSLYRYYFFPLMSEAEDNDDNGTDNFCQAPLFLSSFLP